MISTTHYGSSDAAIYLSDVLREDEKTRSKIDRLMQVATERFHEICDSNLKYDTKMLFIDRTMWETYEAFGRFEIPVSTLSRNVLKTRWKQTVAFLKTKKKSKDLK